MQLKHYLDNKGLIMRSRGNCVDSTQVMEKAFQNIMNEIIEYAIEGICFEAHRAVKLGYFAVDEYVLRESEFIICDGEKMSESGDIFGNTESNPRVISTCPFCRQKKNADTLGRHIINCRSRPKDCFDWDFKENCVNNVEEENNSDGKKGSDSKKQARSAKKYESMTAEEKQDFLKKYCGVVSTHTGKPCGNSLSCNKHSLDKKNEVRGFTYESIAGNCLDGDIDIDTVD